MNQDTELKSLIVNMKIGYNQLEFYENVLPFIVRHFFSIDYKNQNKIFLSYILEEAIHYESFLIAKISNIKDLEDFINRKSDRIKMMFDMVSEFMKT